GVSAPCPDQDAPVFVHRQTSGVDEFVLDCLQGFIIQMELDLERSICNALALAEEIDDLIEDGVKAHLALCSTWAGDGGPRAGHRIRPHAGGHLLYVPQRVGKGKQEVRYGASGAHQADGRSGAGGGARASACPDSQGGGGWRGMWPATVPPLA